MQTELRDQIRGQRIMLGMQLHEDAAIENYIWI